VDSVAAIAEVLAWLGLITAIGFAIIGGVLRLARGAWESAPAEVTGGQLRWMSADGRFHTSPAWSDHPVTDELTIFYRVRRPDVAHPEPIAHDERACRFVALIVAGVSVMGFVVGAVAPMLR
jgi:hypothetical protein